MEQFVFTVWERDENYEWTQAGICASLEAAKDFIRSRVLPEFVKSKNGDLQVYVSDRVYEIRQTEMHQ